MTTPSTTPTSAIPPTSASVLVLGGSGAVGQEITHLLHRCWGARCLHIWATHRNHGRGFACGSSTEARAEHIPFAVRSHPAEIRALVARLGAEGQVVIAGGYTDLVPGQLTGSVEVFDRELGAFDSTRALALTQARAELQLIDLQRDRQFLAIGGISVQGLAIAGVDLFQPLSSRGDDYFVEQIASLTVGRFAQSSTLLPNGMVLTTGGATKPDASTTSTLSTSDIINLGPPSIVTDFDE